MFLHLLVRTLQSCIDVIFPPSTDILLVREAGINTLFARGRLHEVTGIHTLLPFQDPIVRACIHEAKFHENKKAITMLSKVLERHLNTLPHREYLLIPIPLSRARFRERGHNQVASVAKIAMTELKNVMLVENVLVRTRHTKPQTDLPKNKRLQNVADAFGIRDKNSPRLKGAHIILLDDVLTTGATMNAARATLALHKPASITCVALAH